MQKAVIFGAGSMGVAIAYAMCKLGFRVLMVDPDKEQGNNRLKHYAVDASILSNMSEVDLWNVSEKNQPDIVISAAPYHQNVKIAKHCFTRSWRYCDLGGDPRTSMRIARLAKQWDAVACCDTGLAPGISNVLAHAYYKRYSINESIHTVNIKVGGLPVNPVGPLKYGISWSIEGLRNEYTGICDVIENGQLKQKQALHDCQEVVVPGVGALEAFNTKGGIASTVCLMSHYGVKNCSYKTLRYPGHCDLVRFLLEDCKLKAKHFDAAISNACVKTKEDVVHLVIDVNNHRHYASIFHDDIWTAMQKSTAFPAAAIACMVASGKLDHKHYIDYSDIDMEVVQSHLDTIGGLPKLFV